MLHCSRSTENWCGQIRVVAVCETASGKAYSTATPKWSSHGAKTAAFPTAEWCSNPSTSTSPPSPLTLRSWPVNRLPSPPTSTAHLVTIGAPTANGLRRHSIPLRLFFRLRRMRSLGFTPTPCAFKTPLLPANTCWMPTSKSDLQRSSGVEEQTTNGPPPPTGSMEPYPPQAPMLPLQVRGHHQPSQATFK